MNDFDALLKTVLAEVRAAGIPAALLIDPHVRINRRASRRFGCCIAKGPLHIIELSWRLLQADEHICRTILCHEILHTCRGCKNHGARWKQYAARMEQLHGYRVSRTDSYENLGIADTAPAPNYILECTRCGARIERLRRSALVQHPERYRCRCGGALRRIHPPR